MAWPGSRNWRVVFGLACLPNEPEGDLERGHSRKISRLVDLVPGQRILELGAAEGVLSLLLAQNKEKVFALEMKRERHDEALRLKSSWLERGLDDGRCEMVLGNIKDQLHLLNVESHGNPDDPLGTANYYATLEGMTSLLEGCGYAIVNTVADGDPIVIGAKAIRPVK
jgi:predicted O-methyltransferase YrrM